MLLLKLGTNKIQKIMKRKIRLLALAVGVIFIGNIAHADDDVNVAYAELPQKAKVFIEKHFGTNPATQEIEYKDVSGVYTVELKNGYDIKFNAVGKVIEIDSPDRKDIDEAIVKDILPAKIVTYLTTENLIDDVDEIKVQRNGGYMMEIDKISKDRKLRFDETGNLIKSKRR